MKIFTGLILGLFCLQLKAELDIIPNFGQFTGHSKEDSEEVKYIAQMKDYDIYFREAGLSFVLRNNPRFNKDDSTVTTKYHRIDFDFDLAQKPEIIPQFSKNGVIKRIINGKSFNYNSFSEIKYNSIWEGIGLRFYQNQDGDAEFDLIVNSGANPGDISFVIKGADQIRLDKSGDMLVCNSIRDLIHSAPVSFSKNHKIQSSYKLSGNKLSYEIGHYEKSQPLIIDPIVRLWGTLYGGESAEEATGIVTDSDGNVYVCGYTNSENTNNYIATPGAHSVTYQGGSSEFLGDAFIAKFSPAGNRTWSTYFGGQRDEIATGIDIDPSGNIIISGYTKSTSDISTSGAYQENFAGNTDGFIAKFDSSGELQWSTYYGGQSNDRILGQDIDDSGNIFVTGRTMSISGVATNGAHQEEIGGDIGSDAFLIKFNSSGQRQWGTYYGDTETDFSYDCAVDNSGNVFLAGLTFSSSNIATTGAHKTTYSGPNSNAMLVKFNSSGVRQWGTYYGGDGSLGDQAFTVETDNTGNVFVGGACTSSGQNVIATIGAHQTTFGGGIGDGFLVKFSSSGIRQWGTYYGGSDDDIFDGLIFRDGDIYGFGLTWSREDIVTSDAFKDENNFGGYFLTRFSSTGSLRWASFYGCCPTGRDHQGGLAIDNDGNILIASYATDSADYVSKSAFQKSIRGEHDAFLAKIGNLTLQVETGEFKYCTGDSIEVIVMVNSENGFNTNNQFKVEMSDSTGTFNNPTILGTANQSGSFTAKYILPQSLLPATGYRVRVTSDDPSLTSNDNGTNITIGGKPIGEIIGPEVACRNKFETYKSSSSIDFSFQWEAEGGTIEGEDNQNEVIINWGEGDEGRLRVTVTNTESLCTVVFEKTIALINLPDARITGRDEICFGSAAHYLSTIEDGLEYEWEVEGGILAGDPENDDIFVIWDIPETDTGTVRMTYRVPGSSCDSTIERKILVKPIPELALTGSNQVCERETAMYSTIENPDYSYDWQLVGGQIISGSGTASINVQWNTAGTGFLKLLVSSSTTLCSDSARMNIEISGLPELALNGPNVVCGGCTETYFTDDIEGISYKWEVTNGTIIGSDDTPQVVIQWAANGEGNLLLIIQNEDNCTDTLILDIIISNSDSPVIAGNQEVCEGDTVIYTTSSNPDYSNSWWVDGGNVLDVSNHTIEIEWLEAGIGIVNVVRTEIETQTIDSTYEEITINELPEKPTIKREGDILLASPGSKFRWFLNGNPIPEEGNEFNPPEDGLYYVRSISEFGCISELSDAFEYILTDIEEDVSAGIRIIPNPAIDYLKILNLQFENSSVPVSKIQIYNTLGEKVIVENYTYLPEQRVDLNGLPEGVYFLRIGDYFQKFIIGR